MNRAFLKKISSAVDDFFDTVDDPARPHYDPVHLGGMIVIVLFALALLFWLLWSLLVFGGGIQAKILPFLSVIFTSKTFADYGYVGYPYELGAFEGWITNCVALVLAAAVAAAIRYLYTLPDRKAGRR